MTEAEWLASDAPDTMLSALLRLWKRPSGRKLRLFACACCRHVPGFINAEYSLAVVDAVEKFADGLVDNATLARTMSGAWKVRNAHWSLLTRLTPAHVEHVRSRVTSLATDGIGERRYQAEILRDMFTPRRFWTGNANVDQAWRTDTVLALAEGIYQERAFDRMPYLADALQDSGCENEDVLNHCRSEGTHVRGCWVIDLLTGRK